MSSLDSVEASVISGLRRPADEAQLTQVLAAVFRADPSFAARFLSLVLAQVGARRLVRRLPSSFECHAEFVVPGIGRPDLRFVSGSWTVIVELKIHAGYGLDQLERYLSALPAAKTDDAYLVAVTRDEPVYGEPAPGADSRWLGSVRWRSLLPGLRDDLPTDPGLAHQWRLLLDVLESEGSMGFTQPDPQLFDAFARARVAYEHMEEFLRAVQFQLLQALIDVRGAHEHAAAFYFPKGRRFARERWGKIDIPLRIPASGKWRVRAGLIGWTPPPTFYVQPAPDRQRWDKVAHLLLPEVQSTVAGLVEKGFSPSYLRSELPLTERLLASDRLERRVIAFAHKRFEQLNASGILDLPLSALSPRSATSQELADHE